MFSVRQNRLGFQFTASFDIFSPIPITRTFVPNRFHCPSDFGFFSLSPRKHIVDFFLSSPKRNKLFISQAIFAFSLGSEFSPRLYQHLSCIPLTSLVKTWCGGEECPLVLVIGLKFTNCGTCRFFIGLLLVQHWHE